MPTDPLTASRYPASTAVPNVNQDIQNAVIDLADNTIPDFATTTARDNAWAAWVALGNSMRNGLHSVVNGVRWRRIGGTWRVDGDRIFTRTVTPTSPANSITAGGASETGITSGAAAISSFTLYEARRVVVMATFRAGASGGGAAATETIKINGAAVGNSSVVRYDDTGMVLGTVDLAAGTHTIAARVDASGGTIGWSDCRIVIHEGIAE